MDKKEEYDCSRLRIKTACTNFILEPISAEFKMFSDCL